MGHHEHDLGLAYDLATLLNRRRALAVVGAAGIGTLLSACTTGGTPTGRATSSREATPPATRVTDEIPEETAGPFPANGSNGPNALTESGVVRGDITTSFGSASGKADGVPLTVRLKVIDLGNDASPYRGAAIYVWQCDRVGRYSLYGQGVTEQNYLRGVQAADADGDITFTTIYPGAYAGRWPHIHFEVYPSLKTATSADRKLRTSQLALPEDASHEVYAAAGYEQSASNLRGSSLEDDSVFSDGYSLQLATITGDVGGGLTATLTVPV